ncbi:VOC family protein [Pseudoalteromonas luteoviolacea]|uniref:VOC domain-containing protein n=1 Tax=Pseudoalteromonas luteoviolacea S4054 TaxID=1129367 RepID=A0A0F6ACW8_9GAMM|nr:VOC family protein [Pseudoalteromonas luteoviolacea]AOT09756.1 hypothetical protein S4054249_18850 [Pseudoalteromonas luteoviolacea]AOT14669.1 hypothetical protein S40542_18820 [Pseudoalteromonas luteoviolacea]AOT19583.1 hypothetical protein S4054_18825 [Pseudoalteromonas luteoviolacea]KKE84025.1 hypothetical protein N479_11475 [Pseudoalteromonas luteoviolacea S4054]KZN77419.1 hypothetical protein N481_05015 [Pseudoalteromonas luteoviolacea S4047-1]
MEFNNTIPELVCRDIESSLSFYTQKLGFKVLFEREEQGFFFLYKDDIQLMLQQLGETAWMSHGNDTPFGNGMNIAFKVESLENLDCSTPSEDIFLETETIEYRVLDGVASVNQVIFRDPDGYLIRFVEQVNQ